MKLVSVYEYQNAATYLYALLAEREESQNISHSMLPTVDEHLSFVYRRPYRDWFLTLVDARVVGAIYLTQKNEIGIFLFKEFQGKGYGKTALEMLLEKYPGESFVANISPRNSRSLQFFENAGFVAIQVTMTKKGNDNG